MFHVTPPEYPGSSIVDRWSAFNAITDSHDDIRQMPLPSIAMDFSINPHDVNYMLRNFYSIKNVVTIGSEIPKGNKHMEVDGVANVPDWESLPGHLERSVDLVTSFNLFHKVPHWELSKAFSTIRCYLRRCATSRFIATFPCVETFDRGVDGRYLSWVRLLTVVESDKWIDDIDIKESVLGQLSSAPLVSSTECKTVLQQSGFNVIECIVPEHVVYAMDIMEFKSFIRHIIPSVQSLQRARQDIFYEDCKNIFGGFTENNLIMVHSRLLKIVAAVEPSRRLR